MTTPHAQCRGCKTMVIGGAVDALPLIGWVFDAAGWVCPTCETAPRCRACDAITARPGERLCGNCGGEARPS